jgi:hypothetical protein
MIAGEIPAGNWQLGVQRAGEFEIVALGRAVEGEIATVDDEIRTRRVDIFADAMKVVGELLQAPGKVGVGNLGQAKLAHAIFLLPRLYNLGRIEMVTWFTTVLAHEGGLLVSQATCD